jgi:hypothetical protein
VASLTLQLLVCPCDRLNMPRTSICSIRRFPNWSGAALSMGTVTLTCVLILQPGNGQLPKPKRPLCNAQTVTFTLSICGPAPYAMRRVPRLAVQPGPPPRRTARLLHSTRPGPTCLQGSQLLLREQNRLLFLQRANQPVNRPPRLLAKRIQTGKQPPAQEDAKRVLPLLARRRLRPEPAPHRQLTPLGQPHPARGSHLPPARLTIRSPRSGAQPPAPPPAVLATHRLAHGLQMHPALRPPQAAQPPQDALPGKPPPALRRPVRREQLPDPIRLVD